MASKIDEFFSDPNYVVLPKDLIVEIYRQVSFFQTLRREVVERGGRVMAQRLLEKGLSPEDALDAFLYMMVVKGRYADEIVTYEKASSGGKQIVRIGLKGSLFASRMKTGRPVEAIFAGVLSGFLQEVFKAKVRVHEVLSESRGDPYTLFEVEIERR